MCHNYTFRLVHLTFFLTNFTTDSNVCKVIVYGLLIQVFLSNFSNDFKVSR